LVNSGDYTMLRRLFALAAITAQNPVTA